MLNTRKKKEINGHTGSFPAESNFLKKGSQRCKQHLCVDKSQKRVSNKVKITHEDHKEKEARRKFKSTGIKINQMHVCCYYRVCSDDMPYYTEALIFFKKRLKLK